MKNVVKTVNNKKNENEEAATKLKRAIIVLSVVVALVVLLVIIEALGNGKMVIKNDTDLKLESVDVFFATDYLGNEVNYDISRGLSLESGSKEKVSFKSIDMSNAPDFAALTVVFKFEGENELQVSSGEFFGKYDGKINVTFEKRGANYYAVLKTGAGLFYGTSGHSDCNDKFLLKLEEGYVY